MQQVQQREAGERISWARALIFGVGFFFIAALLIGQLPSFVNSEMTSSSLIGFEQAMLALAYVTLGGFLVVQAIVMLFDPKPVVSPMIFAVLGFIFAVVGLAIVFWAVTIGNQFLPTDTTNISSILGGKFLWFPAGSVDMVALGVVLLFVGLAWLFYARLAMNEQNDTDRRDLGTTRGVRTLLAIGTIMLVLFMFFFSFVSPAGLAQMIDPSCPFAANPACGWSTGLFWVNTLYNTFLTVAIVCTLGAFALRLHYLMRPTRKTTMKALYAVGVNLAPIGALCLVAWFAIYPFVGWLHSLPGLGDFFTVCARKSAIPQSCAFSQEGGNLIGAIITTNNFVLLMAAVWAWKTKRNLVVIGCVAVAALLALATLLTHISYDPKFPYQATVALMLCIGGLIMATIWTNVARREFAVVGEKPLGCLGMWLVVGTGLFIYIAAFAFFSIPGFTDTETNIPFYPGAALGIHSSSTTPALDAMVVVVIIGLLAAIQFYFLMRNRYRV
ncbi:MAG TPA: hypothetical protein VFV38_51845 [Ktedonobacteraceae bacterium]|nr:hypothetical protein [Ktedonobacteraceae bacterium]